MPEQIEAVTGRRIRKPYRSMISAQAPHLPAIYAAKEAREYQRLAAGQRARELTLAEKSQKKQEEQSNIATILSAGGTGAMIGGQVGGGSGAIIGGAIGLVGGAIAAFS